MQRRRLLLNLEESSAESHFDDSAQIVSPRASQSTERLRQCFRDCRGREGMRLFVEAHGKLHPAELTLDQPYQVIGSDDSCDIVIHQRGIVPNHVYLQWIDGHVFCRDLSTQNERGFGSWLGSQPIVLGPMRISVPAVTQFPSGIDPEAVSLELANEIPQVQLKFLDVDEQDKLLPIDRKLTLIGRGTNCRVRLDSPQIPLVLASLVRTPSSCWLVDLNRTGQVAVNGVTRELTSLDIGDTIKLGPFTVVVDATQFSLKSFLSAGIPAKEASGLRDLAERNRERTIALNRSLKKLESLLNHENPLDASQIKAALARYMSLAEAHHRDIQKSLDQLSNSNG